MTTAFVDRRSHVTGLSDSTKTQVRLPVSKNWANTSHVTLADSLLSQSVLPHASPSYLIFTSPVSGWLASARALARGSLYLGVA
jgi:hypothetical protein